MIYKFHHYIIFLLNSLKLKVFSTQINENYYALKLLNKKDILKSEQKKLTYFLIEKEIGEMANECKFLVNTVCSFQNEVNI